MNLFAALLGALRALVDVLKHEINYKTARREYKMLFTSLWAQTSPAPTIGDIILPCPVGGMNKFHF